ncbi:hypothetical protein ACQZV8_00970 [Magnetococcales bacterium HHB-1]
MPAPSETAASSNPRYYQWLGRTKKEPPEEIASWIASSSAHWSVIIEAGPKLNRQRYTAYLEEPEDLPYWAFMVAKSFLNDVGEWPLFGMHTELALQNYEEAEEQDPERAVYEIIATIHPVWPDVTVLFVGREEE